MHPRHHARSIDVICGPHLSGWFDQRKLERALYNLLLNACEAAAPLGGKVEVTAGERAGAITISVSDNGPGIAESIREKLFHPFVSYGKENGTGLGLAVVQKIVQDHGGEIFVERTADGKTVFRMVLRGRAQEAMRETSDFTAALFSRHARPARECQPKFGFASGDVRRIRFHGNIRLRMSARGGRCEEPYNLYASRGRIRGYRVSFCSTRLVRPSRKLPRRNRQAPATPQSASCRIKSASFRR